MKNIFIPNMPHSKKDSENSLKTVPSMVGKNTQTTIDDNEKKISIYIDSQVGKPEHHFYKKACAPKEEESISSDINSSCKSSEITTKPSKLSKNPLYEQRPVSPLRYEASPPFSPKPATSPNVKASRIANNNFIPIRATLKNLIQSKLSPPNDKGNRREDYKDVHLSPNYKVNKTATQMNSPLKCVQKQNQILKEQNQMLKRQLNQIKKNLLFGSASKKEELIGNLRDTIKKEDSQIKELRLKLDISLKKNTALSNLIQNKQEEIQFLSNKLIHIEHELRDHKQKNAQKLQKLKERINFILKCYNEVESKYNKNQIQWLNFKQKWMEQKGMYIHRINFLEEYIASI